VWAVATIRAALGDAGVSGPKINATLSSARLGATTVATGGSKNDKDLASLVGVLGAIVLYIAIQLYGGLILMGVVEEKSSAVVEVLLARVRPSHLLAGKVLGVGTVAMLQFVFLLAAAAVSLRISGIHVPAGVWAALPWTAVWFVGGFALYGSLYALAGSMVSRQEDAQGAAIPVNVILVTAYLMIFSLVANPDKPAARVLSLLPPFAPLLMPARIAAGKATVVEIAVAVSLMALAVAGLARASGHIYARLVLHRGRRVSWSEAFRSH
jgi:ABC-2 type transport system permease protein